MPTAAAQPATGVAHVNVGRLTMTGAVTAAIVFVLCWVGTLLPAPNPTHAYISLFTTADIGSGRALAEGSLWSLLFGGVAGAVLAITFNLSGLLGRR